MPIGQIPEMGQDDAGNFVLAKKDPEGQYLTVPITKAKVSVEIDIDALPPDVYKEVLIQGLKHFVNQSMGEIKTTGLKDTALAKAQELASTQAQENVEKLYTGKIRMSKGTRTKTSGAVKTEAMRLARLIIKQAIKDQGGKVSHYNAKDITEAAKQWLETTEEGAECLKEAEANVKARAAAETKAKIDLSGIQPDAKLVKAAEEKKGKAKKAPPPVPGRAKGEAHATQH